ncbi:alpha/beta fold hydrolase [Actinocorallia lasiicapitis]
MNATDDGLWFQPVGLRSDAPHRLFIFHHGGGAAASYARWAAFLPADLELVLVQLPGRHDRRAEPAFIELPPLMEALREAFNAELDGRPYAFFGHSMGGMLAYLLTAQLELDGEEPPALLGVSSWAPLRSRDGALELSRLDDTALVQTVRDLGMLPEVIAASPDMLQVVLPALRADLSVYADYRDPPPDQAVVACPVAAYGALSDPLLVPDAMAAWTTRSRRFLGVSEYPGDHFYLDDHAVPVATDLTRHLHREFTAQANSRIY